MTQRFIYTGEKDIPHDATHVHVVAIIKVIFHDGHSMHVIVPSFDVICDNNVEKIEMGAFQHSVGI